jgi:hypothetical protein
MSVGASSQILATWTHDEWHKHAKNLNDNFDDLENRINRHHTTPVKVSLLGATWRIATACINDLDRATFAESIDPNDKKNVLQRLGKRSLEVATLAQSVLKESVFRRSSL